MATASGRRARTSREEEEEEEGEERGVARERRIAETLGKRPCSVTRGGYKRRTPRGTPGGRRAQGALM